MIKTAVVILNYNGEKLLRQFLPSVLRNTTDAEIIVADNGSTDQSVKVLQVEFPQVRLILLDKNYGFCGGYNRALKQVDATYYLLLNSDIEVTPGWLEPLVEILDTKPTVAAVQPKILSYHHKKKFEYAGAGGGLIDLLGYPFCRGRMFQKVEKDHGQYNDEREIFWATGACFLIRSKTFFRFGGFDEDFFAHMEEIDLCWKINRTEDKVFYCGKSTIYHVGAGTLGYESPRKTYLNFRNGLTLIYKHFSTSELLYKFPARVMLDWVAAVVFLLKGQFKNAVAVLKAHNDFIRNFRLNREKRKKIHREFPTYSTDNIYNRLIILDYYLPQKKS
jgi:GT2 family glycosyltransferase